MLRAALGSVLAFTLAAGPAVDRAAEHFRNDPVFVHEDVADQLSESDADEIRELIRDRADRPVFVAVLPGDLIDDEGGVERALPALLLATQRALGNQASAGTYVLSDGEEIRSGSTTLEEGRAPDLAREANEHAGDGLEVVLRAFVNGVHEAPLETGNSDASPVEESEESSGGSLLPLVVLVGGGLLLFAFFSSRTNRRRAAERRQALQGAQQDLLAEFSVLADDVLRLEPEVDVHPEARQDYDAAVSRYRWLEAAIPQIDSPDDPPRIQRAMGEAKYAMARAQAIVRGHEPPPPPAELTERGRYGEPAIEVDEEDEYRRPRYAGYGGGWYGGGFFGGNDLFTGLLLGSMLGGGWGGGGGGFERGYERGYEEGAEDGGDEGGGDFGGGDFGGGDFGGGDFGGGDFGGGDFGGGDFG